MDIPDSIAKYHKRDDMRDKMQAIIERVLDDVEADAAGALEPDWSNYEWLVRQEFAAQVQDFAGDDNAR